VKKRDLGWIGFAGWMVLSVSGCLGSPEGFATSSEEDGEGVAVAGEELSVSDGSVTRTWSAPAPGRTSGSFFYIPFSTEPDQAVRYHFLWNDRGVTSSASSEWDHEYDPPQSSAMVTRSLVMSCVQGSTTSEVRRSGWFVLDPNQTKSTRFDCPGTARLSSFTVTVRQTHQE
jgi:hypothetical protein